MWAASMTRGPSPRFVPTRFPKASTFNSSTSGRISAATMVRTASSRPAMPGAAQSWRNNATFRESTILASMPTG
jgi:hypothetical protein